MNPKKTKAREGEAFEHFADSRAKWDFSEASLKEHGVLDPDMLMECWAYEFSRENWQLVEAISAWRASLESPLSFEQLKRASAGSPMLRIPGNKREGITERFFTIPFPAIYVLSPEWPEKSFLEIASEERSRRVALASPKLTDMRLPQRSPSKSYSWYTWEPNWVQDLDEYPTSLEANPNNLGLTKKSGWDNLFSDLMASVSSNNKLRAFRDEEPATILPCAEYTDPEAEKFAYALTECVLFRIPWKYSDKVIRGLMEKWLKENRPASENPPKISDRAKTGKTRRQNMEKHLEMLGRLRLVKQSYPGARTWYPLKDDERLFTDDSHLLRTKDTIEREAKRFSPVVSLIKDVSK